MPLESAAQQLVGAVFNGRWRLVRLLGEGGMGAVYEAHGTRGEGARAIKVLHPEFSTEESILGRFMAEAQATQSLDHPNVTRIFEHARAEDGSPYLVMELLQGAPLSSFMTPGRTMPPAAAAGVMLGVLQALTQAHSRGIVHRDLKPDNLFLVPDGRGNQLVKVLDFGIAKVMDAAGGMGSKTKTGVLLGTPGYMSPEQIKNSKGVDPRSDLWSVGVILYELLSGQPAFGADNEFTRLTMVLTQEVRPIGEHVPQLASWSPFFLRALAKEPAQRFQSAGEMGQAIAAMVAGGQSAGGAAGGTIAIQAPAAFHAPSGGVPPQGPSTAASPLRSPSGSMPAMGGYDARMSAPPPNPSAPPPPFGAAPPIHSGLGSMVPPAPSGAVEVRSVQPGSMPPPATYPVQLPAAGVGHGPTPPTGPSTHMSREHGTAIPTLAAGSRSPSVDVITPRPVGAPWWVVGAIATATLVLGFLAGYLAK